MADLSTTRHSREVGERDHRLGIGLILIVLLLLLLLVLIFVPIVMFL